MVDTHGDEGIVSRMLFKSGSEYFAFCRSSGSHLTRWLSYQQAVKHLCTAVHTPMQAMHTPTAKHAMTRRAALCYAVLRCAMLCCAVLCCAALCCAALHWAV